MLGRTKNQIFWGVWRVSTRKVTGGFLILPPREVCTILKGVVGQQRPKILEESCGDDQATMSEMIMILTIMMICNEVMLITMVRV